MNLRSLAFLAVLFLGALGLSQPAAAQQFVYTPVNPAFGGNPLNGQWLLGSANAQKPEESDGQDPFARDPIEDFEQNLQRQILSQLSREIIASRFGDEIDLTQEGRFNLGDFIIDIIPGLNGVNIRILNTLTGDQSTVTIPLI